ncbi:hypothetical protein HON01_08610, partial [Candidatus Woesearchaeota archaeon]|nr:hypothetical protein [Candidatus Woesearchaeota archaeon]
VLVNNALINTDNPLIYSGVGKLAYKYAEKIALFAKLFGSPEIILHMTGEFSNKLNNVLEMREIASTKGGSIQAGEYFVDHTYCDEIFTQGIIMTSPRVLPFYNDKMFEMKCVPTHSQSKFEETVDFMNNFFNSNFSLRESGSSIFLNEQHLGKYVFMLGTQELIEESKGKSQEELEELLKPIEGKHYLSLDFRTAGVGRRVFLCEKDVEVNSKRVLRAGQFYNCEECFDHFYYKPRGGIYSFFSKVSSIFLQSKFQELKRDELKFVNQKNDESRDAIIKVFEEKDRREAEEKKRIEAEKVSAEERAKSLESELELERTKAELERKLEEVNRQYAQERDTKIDAHDIKNDQIGLKSVAIDALRKDLSNYSWDMLGISKSELNSDAYIENNLESIANLESISAQTKYFVVATKEILEQASNSLKRAQKIMGKKIEVVKTEFNYYDFMETVIKAVNIMKPNLNVELLNQIPSDLSIVASYEDLRAAYINLIDNAVDASSEGNVAINASPMGSSKKVHTMISQTGFMSSDLASKLTNGEDVGSSKGDKGHGIGSIASYNIIKEAHGGALMYNGLEDKGAQIRIII